MSVQVRRARASDQAILVDYNSRMAWETEQKQLDAEALTRGVAAVLGNPDKGFYLVAERDGDVVGQLMITREWSDWRNGDFWWIQSVYVREDARRLGAFRLLYQEVERLAREAPEVIGIRLYMEKDNQRARQTYASLGMHETDYVLFERFPL
jgi:GNAT superfamily N-acetyltransferase